MSILSYKILSGFVGHFQPLPLLCITFTSESSLPQSVISPGKSMPSYFTTTHCPTFNSSVFSSSVAVGVFCKPSTFSSDSCSSDSCSFLEKLSSFVQCETPLSLMYQQPLVCLCHWFVRNEFDAFSALLTHQPISEQGMVTANRFALFRYKQSER